MPAGAGKPLILLGGARSFVDWHAVCNGALRNDNACAPKPSSAPDGERSSMKKWTLGAICSVAVLLAVSAGANAATISLAEHAVNVNGTVTTGGGITALFDTTTGLGTLSVTVSGAGANYIAAFFDHEIDAATNTFFNELGSSGGAAPSGVTWEIDEPGFAGGDIYDNFEDGALDGTIGFGDRPDDVSMALAWSFSLLAGQTALIEWILSETAPTDGFFLRHFDPDSDASVFLSSRLTIRGEPTEVPTPPTLALFGLGLLGAAFARRRRA
jgi:MYXO-CTERM domain-containing protein